MKRTVKFLAVGLIISIVLSTVIGAPAFSEEEVAKAGAEYEALQAYEELSRAQAPAVEAGLALYTLFPERDQKTGMTVYPEWYGGCYIGEDNVFYVKIVEGNNASKSLLAETISSELPYEIIDSDISYNELARIRDEIVETIDDINIRYIAGAGIDEITSKISIDLFEPYYNEAKLVIKEILSEYYSRLDFTVCYDTSTQANLFGGDKLTASDLSIGTLGWCGTYGGVSCVVTAGHVAQGRMLYHNGIYLGINTVVSFSSGCWGDYAIIALSSSGSFTPTNQARMSSSSTVSLSYVAGSLITGQAIAKYGATTGKTTGVISSTGYAWKTDGLFFVYGIATARALNYTDVISAAGDSGGPVWTTNQGNILAGIVNGGRKGAVLVDDGATFYTMFFTPMTTIMSTGFTPKLS